MGVVSLVHLKGHLSIRDAQDDLVKRIHRARTSSCPKESSLLMVDALVSLDAHFKPYRKYYE